MNQNDTCAAKWPLENWSNLLEEDSTGSNSKKRPMSTSSECYHVIMDRLLLVTVSPKAPQF